MPDPAGHWPSTDRTTLKIWFASLWAGITTETTGKEEASPETFRPVFISPQDAEVRDAVRERFPAKIFHRIRPGGIPEKFPRRAIPQEADDRAIRAELGWQPPFSLEEGLRLTAQWYRAQGG